jgi:molybdopterin converting factor small subunit
MTEENHDPSPMTIILEATGSLGATVGIGDRLTGVHTVGEALARLTLPADVAVTTLVNGRVAHWTTPLHDGDVLTLIPAICGG